MISRLLIRHRHKQILALVANNQADHGRSRLRGYAYRDIAHVAQIGARRIDQRQAEQIGQADYALTDRAGGFPTLWCHCRPFSAVRHRDWYGIGSERVSTRWPVFAICRRAVGSLCHERGGIAERAHCRGAQLTYR
jgi:hypothetical protein